MVVKRFKNSFQYAGRGFLKVFKSEFNFRIEVIIGILAIAALLYFDLPLWQSVIVLLLVTVVLVMELLNTAFEYVTDLLKPRLNPYVAAIKDVFAAAVFIMAIGSAIIGVLIFWPYFMSLTR